MGDGMALDPQEYFVIVPNMLRNGLSCSPSNTPPPYDRARFPQVTVHDNVAAQHRLVTERFGIERLALVVGYSMGAQQTFQWGASYPEMVERILPFCGSARTSPHNFVFLEGVKAVLTADAAFEGGGYDEPPTTGLRAMARVYAGWALSQAFYRERVYLEQGYSSLEDYLIAFWEGNYVGKDANDLLAMLWTWQHADIGATPGFGGDLEMALGAIGAKALVMPGRPTSTSRPKTTRTRSAACQTPSSARYLRSGATSPAAAGTQKTSALSMMPSENCSLPRDPDGCGGGSTASRRGPPPQCTGASDRTRAGAP